MLIIENILEKDKRWQEELEYICKNIVAAFFLQRKIYTITAINANQMYQWAAVGDNPEFIEVRYEGENIYMSDTVL